MTKKYDLIVIGSGSAGSVAASKCNQAGWKVAIIDERPLGGTCALRGCDPKKVLHGAAELYDWQKRMKGKGIIGDISIDWSELIAFKRTFTAPVPEQREKAFNKQGIDTYRGKVTFSSETTVTVEGTELEGDKFLIASGAIPRPLAFEGSKHLIHSDAFMALNALPETIVFVGGGYISFEFAHLAARAGAKVHIIQRGDRALKHFDPELVKILLEKTSELGIDVHIGHEVNRIVREADGYTVHAKTQASDVAFSADLVVHGAGRVPALNLALEKANITSEKEGISVNEYLQSSSNQHVYAAGDVVATTGLRLTPIASMESHIVAKNLLNDNQQVVDYRATPSVVFTVPKLASVGMTSQEAEQSNRNIVIKYKKAEDWFTHKRTNESHAAFKIIIDKDEDKILGAHLLSEEADELINHFATAIQVGLTTNALKQMIYAYPTAASDIAHML